MASVPGFFARQPVMVNMLMVVVLIAGMLTLKSMPVENSPSVDMDSAIILVAYPGASPEDVEKLITLPIEEAVSTLKDVDYVIGTSLEGRSSFFVQYEAGIENFDQAFLDLKAEVDKKKPELPQEAQDNLFYIKISSDEVWPVINVVLGGDYSDAGITQISDSIKEELLKINGVGSVSVRGTRNRQIWVEADQTRLAAAGISLMELYSAVQAANINLPSGTIEMGREEFLVRAMGEVNKPEELENVIIRSSSNGSSVRIKDVALVKDTFEKDSIISRLDGDRSVSLQVFMKRDASVVDIVDEVKKLVTRYKNELPDISITTRHDSSEDVRESVKVLTSNALTGLALVMLLMTFSIGLRGAVLAMIGIPFAFLTAFIFLGATGGTINTLSLFAFILVSGMLVDDAIIIIENVYRHLEEGKPPLRAAIEGAEQVMWPIISAITTTIAAFLPLLLMEGMIGKFLAVLPIVVSIALVGSLVQSLVVLPSHLADFGRLPKKSGSRRGDRFYAWLSGTYEKQLKFLLKYRYSVALGTLIATVLVTAGAASLLRVEMFPPEPRSTERMLVRLPTGSRLEETRRVVEEMERRIRTMPQNEIVSISSLVGIIVENYNWTQMTEGAMITLELGDSDQRRDNDAIKNDIRKLIADMPEIKSAYFGAGQDGPPTGSPIELRVRGDNMNKMRELSEMIMDDMRKIKGITDISSDYRTGKKELRFVPDRDRMSTYGITMNQLATIMRTAIEGVEATAFRDERGDEIKVIVKYKEEFRINRNELGNMVISTAQGLRIPLSELGEFVIERGAASINRRDRMRNITITANVNRVDINSDEANRLIRKKYENFSTQYPGYSLDFGGEAEEQQKSFASLMRAFVVALLLIFLILGTQFKSFLQPLIVMFTVPFSLLGVSLGLIVMNLTFSLVAGISVVALAGVVVNDSLVLVDFVNRARAQGMSMYDALIVSGSRRMRPILLTTITTIAGLVPMSMGWGGSSETWQPMAICIIWGLAFATFLTLFVIPCTYSIADNWNNWLRRRFGMKSTSEIMRERLDYLTDDTIAADLKDMNREV